MRSYCIRAGLSFAGVVNCDICDKATESSPVTTFCKKVVTLLHIRIINDEYTFLCVFTLSTKKYIEAVKAKSPPIPHFEGRV